jgi:hypothetical protein
MGGFGSGRHGGSVTAEGTASYIIAISSLRSFLQKGECLTGTISFNEGRFPIVITVDSSKLWDAFVELIRLTVTSGRATVWLPTASSWPGPRPPMGADAGGFCARGPAAAPQSCFCRMVAGTSGAAKPTAPVVPASAKIDLVGFNEGLPCSIASLAARAGEPGTRPPKAEMDALENI